MKNILYVSIIILSTLISGQLTAQDVCDGIENCHIPNCKEEYDCAPYACVSPGPTGADAQTYRKEIEDRFTNNDWLQYNETEGGSFNCQKLYDTINNQLTNNNFVILNDRDFYDDTGMENDLYGGNLRNRSHWPRKYFGEPEDVNNNPETAEVKFFLLTPGDYRDYENLFIYNAGTNDQKKYILYYDGPNYDGVDASTVMNYFKKNLCSEDYHPKKQSTQKQAIIERFYMHNPYQEIGNWVISGITIRGNQYSYPGANGQEQSGGIHSEIRDSDNSIIKSCLFENITGHGWTDEDGKFQSYGHMFLHMRSMNNNIITDCVFTNKNECIDASNPIIDMIGIFLRGHTNAASNNFIIGNTMRNVGQAIQVMPSSVTHTDTWGAPGTLIYNNNMYNEHFFEADFEYKGTTCTQEYMNGEGAVAFKMGVGPWGCNTEAVPVNEKVIIANNKIYGWRRGFAGGGNGYGISLSQNSKNIVIMDNEISDCVIGIAVPRNMGCYKTRETAGCNILAIEHIEVYNNKIWDLYPKVSQYNSSCRPTYSMGISIGNSNVKVIGNSIKNSVHGIFIQGRGLQAEIRKNYVENINQEWLFGLDPTNFSNNTYVDYGDICHVPDDTEALLPTNCFICPDRQTPITENICDNPCPQ